MEKYGWEPKMNRKFTTLFFKPIGGVGAKHILLSKRI